MSLSEADKRRVGGSDIAALMGLDPRRSAVGVYARIVHGVEMPPTEWTDRGDLLEPAVLSAYSRKEQRRVKRKVTLDLGTSGDRYRCNLDGVSFTGPYSPASPKRVTDAKTAGRFATGGWGEPGTAEVPDYVALQQHWYVGWGLEVGAIQDRVADVPCLLLGDYKLYRVEFDPEIFGQCREEADRFWRDHVVPRRPPPAVPLPSDEALVRRIRREMGPVAVPFEALTDLQQVLTLEYLLDQKVATQRQDRADTKRAEIMLALAAMGAGGITGLPADTGHSAITWSTRKGVTKTDWEAVAREMAVMNDWSQGEVGAFATLVQRNTTTSEPTRTWRPVPLKEPKE